MSSLGNQLINRWRPREGWVSLFLMAAIASTLITAVVDANWVTEGNVVTWTISVGLILSLVLAKRQISWIAATLLLTCYGLFTTIIYLGNLVPPLELIYGGVGGSLAYIRQHFFLFFDRIGGWLEAAFTGETSEETVVFAIGLGLISWALISFAVWSTYRHKNPLNGLIAIGTALGINTFYSGAADWSLIVFVSLAVLLTAVSHLVNMESIWDKRLIDYPQDVRIELLLAAGGVALVLMSFSFIIPTLSIQEITRAIVEQPVVQQVEQSFERVFAGVNLDKSPIQGQDLERVVGGNALPRSFLIGNPPELAERLVFTATLSSDDDMSFGGWPVHWRAFSYDSYTGNGWLVSSERVENVPAGEKLAVPPIASSKILTQSVHWQLEPSKTRYSLGLPLSFTEDVSAYWRGVSDLSQVQGEATTYSVESEVISASPSDLRSITLDSISETILARYTQLPDAVPNRVKELAQDVAGVKNEIEPALYDQVKAIESFLRQYPYSLEVPAPPRNRELAEYFLFDLQTGYCDYYATAMVVMVRSLGIPARFATGFLPQTPDEKGVQKIYQLNAHSWAEVYLGKYGWVEFEPTAPFPRQDELEVEPEFQAQQPPDFSAGNTLPIPSIPAPNNSFPGIQVSIAATIILILLITAVFVRKKSSNDDREDVILHTYGRLLRSANSIGQQTPASQTPIEFQSALNGRLASLNRQSNIARRIFNIGTDGNIGEKKLSEDSKDLVNIFISHQYGKSGQDAALRTAENIWRRIRLRLWLLGILNKFRNYP